MSVRAALGPRLRCAACCGCVLCGVCSTGAALPSGVAFAVPGRRGPPRVSAIKLWCAAKGWPRRALLPPPRASRRRVARGNAIEPRAGEPPPVPCREHGSARPPVGCGATRRGHTAAPRCQQRGWAPSSAGNAAVCCRRRRRKRAWPVCQPGGGTSCAKSWRRRGEPGPGDARPAGRPHGFANPALPFAFTGSRNGECRKPLPWVGGRVGTAAPAALVTAVPRALHCRAGKSRRS